MTTDLSSLSLRFRNSLAQRGSATLALLLLVASCSTRHTAPSPRPEELADFVLIIKESPDGQVNHSWQHAADFDLAGYNQLSTLSTRPGDIVLASSRPRDCDQEHIDCFRDCMKRRLPSHLNHIRRGDGSKRDFCATECLNEYMRCIESQKARAVEFPVMNDAVDWLKQNRKALLIGIIVVIAGVAFVTISAGAGVVVLAPVVLVAG